ncbi:SDR family oxidoreductase [Emticicia sp. BO119]|uniref:SDR family NAD(P)-dependent oxidoreductase n=1 Tax=Emticicia sp. BO119 TaxID=2757768 RepID=UPI0015F05DE5|nr:SDR family NAD(P)-dependent oxidoreductase [Emticicia sp. BO119]MBA4850354.1 SDR family NAD(P)-dependent oxidoreductase [Emticicia sp. BO119]
MSQIKDSVFIVTGAASGIGRALAMQAADAGARVIATDINEAGLNETINLATGIIEGYILDVSDAEQIKTFATETIKKHFHERFILVNNAGVALFSGGFLETSLADFEWLLNINLWGVVRMTKAFLRHFVKQNQGHIVNVSSIFGITGMPENSAYSTAKFAVKGFSDVLKFELLRTNVKISTVHPGGIKTNIARNSRVGQTKNNEEGKKAISKFERVALKTSSEKAAAIILAGIEKDKPRILVGNDARTMDLIARVFPNTYHKVLAKMLKL